MTACGVVAVSRAWYAKGSMVRHDLRNIALVAHVDHGKTSVVEQMVRFASNQPDGTAQEAIFPIADAPLFPVVRIAYGEISINVIDTPGQGDFGGEAERAIQLADGVMLIVDATEGPLPHSRFALRKAIELGLPIVVVVNKVDLGDADPERVVTEVRTLFEDLEASPQQLAFPVVFTAATSGLASREPDLLGTTFSVLFETLIECVPPPAKHEGDAVVMCVHRRVHDEAHGPLAIGRVCGGPLRPGQPVTVFGASAPRTTTPGALLVFDGRDYRACEAAEPGDVLAVAGLGEIHEGDVVTTQKKRPTLAVRCEEPTLSLPLSVNRSPMAGKSRSSHFLTARHLEQRLGVEARRHGGIRFEATDDPESFRLFARGELLLSTLVESMRREGYEMELGRPEVVTRESDGQRLEPLELVVIDTPNSDVGAVTQRMNARGGRLVRMSDPGLGRARLEFQIRSRALLGCRRELRRTTRGMALVTTLFEGWTSWEGERVRRPTGAIVSDRDGRATPYALFHLQPRGVLFEGPGAAVYRGMIVGEHNRGTDIWVNVTKERKVADVRSRGREQRVLLMPAAVLTVGRALAWIDPDELVEVTPESVRVRKAS